MHGNAVFGPGPKRTQTEGPFSIRLKDVVTVFLVVALVYLLQLLMQR